MDSCKRVRQKNPTIPLNWPQIISHNAVCEVMPGRCGAYGLPNSPSRRFPVSAIPSFQYTWARLDVY